MASLDSLQVRKLAARGAIQVSRDDTPIMLRLIYIGTGTVTSVVVTTATNVVTTTTEGVKTYAFATYTTLGALADAINSDNIFEAKVLDALRSDSVNSSNIVENTTIVSGTDDNGVTVYDLHSDDSVNKFITSALSLRRNFNSTAAMTSAHRVNLSEIVYYAVVNGASANSVRVYYRNMGGVETQQMGFVSVASTKTTINWAAGFGYLTAPEGATIIVRVQDSTSLADSANNFLQITGLLE